MPLTFHCYSDLIAFALKNHENEQHWATWLRFSQKREEAEKDILKTQRRQHPGLTNTEILERHQEYLDKNFPVPSFPWTVDLSDDHAPNTPPSPSPNGSQRRVPR